MYYGYMVHGLYYTIGEKNKNVDRHQIGKIWCLLTFATHHYHSSSSITIILSFSSKAPGHVGEVGLERLARRLARSNGECLVFGTLI